MVFNSETMDISKQLFSYRTLEQTSSSDNFSQDREISSSLNADIFSIQAADGCWETSQTYIPIIARQRSQGAPSGPEIIEYQVLESVKPGAEQHTNPDATSIELLDSEVYETLSGSAPLRSLGNKEESSNSVGYGTSDVAQSAEAQTLHGGPSKLTSPERVESIATEERQVVPQSVDCYQDGIAVHDTPNINTAPISERESKDSGHSQAAGSTKENPYVVDGSATQYRPSKDSTLCSASTQPELISATSDHSVVGQSSHTRAGHGMKSLIEASLNTEAATQTTPPFSTPSSPCVSTDDAYLRRPRKRQLDDGLDLESTPERRSSRKRTKRTRPGLVEWGAEGMMPELTVEETNSSRLKVDHRVRRKIGNISKMAEDVANLVDSLLTEVGKLKSLYE